MMTSYVSRAGAGNVTSGESEVTFYPREPLAGPGILYLHGSGATYASHSQATRWASTQLASYLSRAGFPGVSIEMHGSKYGNDVTVADCVDGVAWLNEATGADADKVLVVATSMGNATAIRLVIEHPDLVAGIVGFIPMVSIVNAYEDDILGLRSAIGTAWGVTYPTPLPADADLLAQAGTILSNGIPMLLFFDEADPVIDSADVAAFATASGATTIQIDPEDPLHTESALKWAVDHGDGKAQTIIDFLTDATGA